MSSMNSPHKVDKEKTQEKEIDILHKNLTLDKLSGYLPYTLSNARLFYLLLIKWFYVFCILPKGKNEPT